MKPLPANFWGASGEPEDPETGLSDSGKALYRTLQRKKALAKQQWKPTDKTMDARRGGKKTGLDALHERRRSTEEILDQIEKDAQ